MMQLDQIDDHQVIVTLHHNDGAIPISMLYSISFFILDRRNHGRSTQSTKLSPWHSIFTGKWVIQPSEKLVGIILDNIMNLWCLFGSLQRGWDVWISCRIYDACFAWIYDVKKSKLSGPCSQASPAKQRRSSVPPKMHASGQVRDELLRW